VRGPIFSHRVFCRMPEFPHEPGDAGKGRDPSTTHNLRKRRLCRAQDDKIENKFIE